jgi:hypothetical protein
MENIEQTDWMPNVEKQQRNLSKKYGLLLDKLVYASNELEKNRLLVQMAECVQNPDDLVSLESWFALRKDSENPNLKRARNKFEKMAKNN